MRVNVVRIVWQEVSTYSAGANSLDRGRCTDLTGRKGGFTGIGRAMCGMRFLRKRGIDFGV